MASPTTVPPSLLWVRYRQIRRNKRDEDEQGDDGRYFNDGDGGGGECRVSAKVGGALGIDENAAASAPVAAVERCDESVAPRDDEVGRGHEIESKEAGVNGDSGPSSSSEPSPTASAGAGPPPAAVGEDAIEDSGGADLLVSFDAFVRDASALVTSDEFVRLRSSACRLAVAAASATAATATAAILMPIAAPASVVSSTASAVVRISSTAVGMALDAAGRTVGMVAGPVRAAAGAAGSLLSPPDGREDVVANAGDSRDRGLSLSEVVPLVVTAVVRVKDEVVLGAALPLLGWQSAGQSSSEGGGGGSCCGGGEPRRRNDATAQGSSDERMAESDPDGDDETRWVPCGEGSSPSEGNTAPNAVSAMMAAAVAEHVRKNENERDPPRRLSSFSMRVCDLDLLTPVNNSDTVKDDRGVPVKFLEFRHYGPNPPLVCRTDDDDLSTRAMDALARRALLLAAAPASSSSYYSEGVEWKPEGPTARLLRRFSSSDDDLCNNDIGLFMMLEREVLLWSSKTATGEGGTAAASSSYGEGVPMFKGRGVVTGLAPEDFADLLLDSERVGEYNRYALARVDEAVLQRGAEAEDAGNANAIDVTKVVRSENRVPFVSRTVMLRNVMHARRLEEVERPDFRCGDDNHVRDSGEGHGAKRGQPSFGRGYVIVSRSVRLVAAEQHATSMPAPWSGEEEEENEIIWGVNVLRAVPGRPDATELTCISQVRSTLVPGFLQERMGIIGVTEFFRSTRALGRRKKKMERRQL